MGLTAKIAYNTAISTIGKIIGVALSLISIGFIARYLGQEGFGSYSLILAFLSIFNVLADFGLYSLMVREISRPNADEKKIASNIFSLRVVILIISLGIAFGAVWFFPYPHIVKIGVGIGAIAFLLLSASQALMGIFQKYLHTDRPALAEVIGRGVQLCLVIIFIHFNLGLIAILLALIAGCFFIFILNIYFARKYIPVRLSFDFYYWKKLIKTAFPIAVSIVLTLIYFKIDSVFLSLGIINRSSASPISDVGVYNIAYKVLEGLIFFPSMFVGLIMPLLSKHAFRDQKKFKQVFQKGLDTLLIFIVPVIIGLFLLASPIAVLIGGKEFIASGSVLKILSFAIGIIFLGSLFGQTIVALNKQKIGAWIFFAGMVFNIVANLIFIPKYSYLGAAWTTVFTELLVTVLMLILIWKTISYFPSFKIIFKALFAGITMGAVIYYFQTLNLLFLVLLGIIVYLCVLYAVKGIKKQELLMLIKK